MKKGTLKRVVSSLALIALLGAGTYAFADWREGRGGGMGPGYHAMTKLSAENIQKLKDEQSAFWKATETLRRDLYAKRLELRSELAKTTPSAQKAMDLQKELSALRSQLGQKRIEHILALKKIDPNIGDGRFGAGRFSGRGARGFAPCAGGGQLSGRGPMGFGPHFDRGCGQ